MSGQEEKSSKKILYTKKVLQNGLIELMKKMPLTEISVKDICETSHISRSTFYLHYKDKHSLLGDIEKETMVAVGLILEKYTKGPFDLSKMLEEILAFIAANSNSVQVLLSENGDIEFQKTFFSRFTDPQQMVPYMGNRSDAESMKGYFLVFAVNGCIALIQQWLKNGMNIPIPVLAGMMVQLTKG
jgi:AcrR family transcriptional regulator